MRNAEYARIFAWLIAIAAIVVLILWYIGVFGGNVHAVVPGRVYRSAELTGHNLDSVLADDNIKTELNLRGGSVANGFYRDELAQCQAYGVTHYDVPMSARKLPTPAQLDSLLWVFDHAKYPILFHCSAGSDRTGLVATIYMNVYQHMPLDQAEAEELTFRYGHVSFGQTHAMNDFFTLYRQTSSGLDLRKWILKKYPAVYISSTQ